MNNLREVKDDLLEEIEVMVEKEYKFKIVDHALKFYGICNECQEKNNEGNE